MDAAVALPDSKGISEMSQFEIIRTDINKTVLKVKEFTDADSAVGSYISALMLVGIIKMSRSGEKLQDLGAGKFRLSNGWEIEVREVSAA